MVDWKSPQVLAANGIAFKNFMHVLLGIYLWEVATSLNFEWSFISGRKKFRWPLIFYFAGRYALLSALVGIVVALNVTSEVDCQALYTFNSVVGNAAIGFASLNLSLRTMAVWSNLWWIVLPLVLISLGHWSLLVHGVLLKAVYVPGTGCVITQTNNTVLSASFIYTMAFDFIVLTLTALKLFAPSTSRSRLMNLIFGDGLIYFMVAFIANTVATTFMLLDLNPIMSVIFNVPSAVAGTIVSSRAIRRLSDFTSPGPQMWTSSGATFAFRKNTVTSTTQVPSARSGGGGVGGVHVQMDTFSVPDHKHSFMDIEAGTNKADIDQSISDDFKRPPYR